MSIPRTLSSGAKRGRLRNPGFHARLRQLLGAERPYAWAERMGISKGAFTRIWKEGTVPTSELLLRIRAATGISLEWLLAGEGAPRASPQPDGGDLVLVKMHAAGKPARRAPHKAPRAREDYVALRREWVLQRLRAQPEALVFVAVKGESMAPTLADGDLALVDCRSRTPDEDGIYVLQEAGSLAIRRVQRLGANRYQALSDNPRYLPYPFRLTARLSIVGRVVWVGKRV